MQENICVRWQVIFFKGKAYSSCYGGSIWCSLRFCRPKVTGWPYFSNGLGILPLRNLFEEEQSPQCWNAKGIKQSLLLCPEWMVSFILIIYHPLKKKTFFLQNYLQKNNIINCHLFDSRSQYHSNYLGYIKREILGFYMHLSETLISKFLYGTEVWCAVRVCPVLFLARMCTWAVMALWIKLKKNQERITNPKF